MSKFKETLPVLYPDRRYAYTVDERTARQMTRSGVAEGEGNTKHIHRLILCEGPSRPVAGTRYSHCRENSQRGPYAGVQNVWTLRRLDDGTREGVDFASRAFLAVQLDCLTSR